MGKNGVKCILMMFYDFVHIEIAMHLWSGLKHAFCGLSGEKHLRLLYKALTTIPLHNGQRVKTSSTYLITIQCFKYNEIYIPYRDLIQSTYLYMMCITCNVHVQRNTFWDTVLYMN